MGCLDDIRYFFWKSLVYSEDTQFIKTEGFNLVGKHHLILTGSDYHTFIKAHHLQKCDLSNWVSYPLQDVFAYVKDTN